MSETYFVTGTDTGVGKTFISCALLHAWRRAGLRVAGYKPVASGAERAADGRLLNEDAVQLHAAGMSSLVLEEINPVCLEEPAAPHIVARKEGVDIDFDRLLLGARALAARVDRLVVEAAGGWLVPLNEERDFADLAVALAAPVILVVGLRLGCISHARLSAEAIRARGLRLAGWVANTIDADMPHLQENVETLIRHLDCPLLGLVPRLASAQEAASFLTLPAWAHGAGC